MVLTAVPFLRRMTWRLPDTYHSAGHGRGTATLKFYEGWDNLRNLSRSLAVGDSAGQAVYSQDLMLVSAGSDWTALTPD